MFLKLAYLPSKLLFSGKYLFLEHQISAGQLSADSSPTETLYCLNSSSLETLYCVNSARPRKIPGWIVVVRENFSVNKGTYRK